MASFSVALQSVVFLTLMAANSLESAKIFPSKDRISDINNELWVKESNLVEAPEPTLFWKVFEKPKVQKFTENYVKYIVKALHKFDSFHKLQQKTVPRSENQELKSDTKTTLIPIRNGLQKLLQSTSTENDKELSSPIPPVVEDLSDIVPHLSPQIEVDKSQKFTHSIRYGYGKPPF